MSNTTDRWSKLWALISNKRLSREVDDELAGHIDMLARQLMAEGMNAEEAYHQARRRFGVMKSIRRDAHRVKSAHVRGQRRFLFFDGLRQDVRFSIRTLLRSPLFTSAAVLSLAIGIGANTAVFTLMYGFLIKPLPLEDSERLVSIRSSIPEQGIERWSVTWNEFMHFSENSHTLAEVAAHELTDLTIIGGDEPQRVMALRVWHNYFDVLSVQPVIGRNFLPSDSEPGASGVAMLGYGIWRSNFAGDEDVVGRTIHMNSEPFTIIGVMPSYVGDLARLWIPIQSDRVDELVVGRIRLLGRLEQGITIKEARIELDGLRANLAEVNPEESANKTIVVESYRKDLMNDSGTSALIFYVIVSLVLLLACANVANLLIARGATRRQEVAVRASLGAGRMRIIRQLLVESMMLAMVGGVFGLILGRWGRDILMAAVPDLYETVFSFDFNLTVIAIVVGLTVLCGLIAGLIPAVLSTRSDLAPVLRGGSNQSIGRLRRSTFQSVLVGLEVGMAVLVLISAGLMIKGFLKIESMELGFNPDDLIHMEINLSSVGYEERSSRIQFYRDMIAQIERHPAVSSVSASNPLPYIGWYTPYEIDGADPDQFSHTRSAIDAVVTPGHFRTMEIQLLSGRDFDLRDTGEESVPAVVVSETFARLNWPDEDPIGKRMRYVGENSLWREVIGVVGDTRAGTFMPESGWFYIPHGQWPSYELILAVRTLAEPAAIMEHVKGLVWAIEPDLAMQWNGILSETIADRYPEPPLYSMFLGIFALLAVIMACVGVYGVVAYSVVRRSREFGIRLSIGARPTDVVSLVLRQSGRVIMLGMAGGFLASLILMRLAASIFFGVSPYDPFVYLICALIMITITLLAMWQPARRASRLDPVRVLRVE